MTRPRRALRPLLLTSTCLLLLGAGGARAADLTGAYDGSLVVPRSTAAASLAGALEQRGGTLSGTVAITTASAGLSGVYYVRGKVRGRTVVLTGVGPGGVRFKWGGKARGDALRGQARLRGTGGRLKGLLTLVRRGAEPPAQPRQTCDSSFFDGQVMGRVLKPICANCHVAGGAAQATNFRVTPDDPLATQQSIAGLIDVSDPESSRILEKPLAEMPHGGGQQLQRSSDEFKILDQWVNLVATNQQCNAGASLNMVPLTPAELLVRASMDLRGKRPALADLDAIEADPNAYAGLVDQYLQSPEFITRVKEAFNDALLVDREDYRDESLDRTKALYDEPLELIAYIIKNDHPLTEMGTADYTVMNEQFENTPRMPYAHDPVTGPDFVPTKYDDGRPMAGVLSTSAFYQVWITNDTNKNRRRANRLSILFHCYNFLDTPVDVTRNVDNNDANAVLNAVTTRPDCKACHDRLDPMASFLFPMDDAGFDDDSFNPIGDPTNFWTPSLADSWRTRNKRPPAVYGVPGMDIRDEGRLLVANPKFAQCQTNRAFRLLFLRDPESNDELATAATLAGEWTATDGYNFRTLVRRWMLSDVYTKRPDPPNADWVRRVSPERFETLMQDLTGFLWARPPQNDNNNPNGDPNRTDPVPLLTTEGDPDNGTGGFKIILGGLNGVNVSARSYSLNASVAMVQRKVAALAADYVVTNDLAFPDGQRKLLNGVTGTEAPATDEPAIRAAIAQISRRLTGEHLATNAPQVDVWFALFKALYADRSQSGTNSNQVPGTQSERAWRGLLTAMLRSPQLLLY
ncbi:MAG TPA: hypothetical protein VKW76_03000 [Candidatus Binatia bacterium]|nr:hypothetical protein [Candidatus Binatia bacterium]